MLPRVPGVGGLINSIAYRKIRPPQTFATSYVNNVGIRWRDGERTDRPSWLIIEDRSPRVAEVGGFPYAPVIRRHVENVLLPRDASDGNSSSAAKWADHPPAQTLIERRVEGLGEKNGGSGEKRKDDTD